MSALTESQRSTIAELAAIILPGTDTQPPARGIDVESAPLDRVLRSRPDLEVRLLPVLERFTGNAEAFLHRLPDTDFDVLLTVVCAAYVLEPRVRKALGYDGQQALSPNRGGFGAEELVMEMLGQPKRYRRE